MAGFGAAELLGWTPVALAAIERMRGWTEQAIERLELSYLADEHRAGIPVRDETLADLGTLRYDPTGKRTPKMLADTGVPRELFPPPESIADDEPRGRRLWLVEGEPDAVRMWSLGLPAVAVPGAQNWRDEWAARFTGRRWQVAVCFDCDPPGRDGAARAAAALTAAGVDVHLVELDPDRDDGYDLSDFTAAAATAQERDQAAALLEQILDRTDPYRPEVIGEHGPRPWRSVTWAAFRDTAPPAHRWLVDGLLPEGVLAFVAGPPKRGKTWVGISIALALALGVPLAPEPNDDQDDRFAGFEIPHPRDVLYVALEGSQTGLRTRIGALARGAGADPDSDDLERLHMLYRPRPFNLAELATADWLLEEALDVDAALILIDVLRAAARFQENVAEDFNRIRDHLSPLLAGERTIMLLHHFGKLNETQKERSPGERMAGTGAMYGALDVGFLITRSEDGARRLGVVVEARDFAAPDALGLAITGTGSGKHGGFTYADSAAVVTDTAAADDRDLAAELEALFVDDPRWRTLDEIRGKKQLSPPGPSIAANYDVLSAAIDPLCQWVDTTDRTRFVRLAGGATVGRSATAKPYGTWSMYDALPAPRPVRLAGPSERSLAEGPGGVQEALELPPRGPSAPKGAEGAEGPPRDGATT